MDNADIRTQTYNVTAWHNVSYQLWTYFGSMVRWPGCLVWLIVLIVMPTLIGFTDHSFNRFLIVFAIMLGLWLIVIPALSIISVLSAVRKSTTAVGWRDTTLTANDVITSGDGFNSRLAWSTFRAVRRAGRAVHLVMHLRAGIVIPRQAFIDDAAREAFFRKSVQHIKNANHKQVGVFYEQPKLSTEGEGLSTPPFELSFGLYVFYGLPLVYKSFIRPIVLIMCLAGFIGFPLWISRERLIAGDWKGPVITALTSFSGFLLLFPPVATVISWFQYRKKPGFAGQRVVTISETGVTMTGQQFDGSFGWRDIRAVTRRGRCLTFWNSAQGGVLVDCAAFPDRDAAQAFYDQAVTWWKAAKGSPAANSALDVKG